MDTTPEEINYEKLLQALKNHDYDRSMELLQSEMEYSSFFERNKYLNSSKKLVTTLIRTKYYEYVKYEKYKMAAIFAVLYSNTSFDKSEVLDFLKQQTLETVAAQFNVKFDQVLISHGLLETENPTPTEVSFVDCIHSLYGSVTHLVACHAYTDQCFDMKFTLTLLSNVQVYIEKFAAKCIRIFIDHYHYDTLFKNLIGRGNSPNQQNSLMIAIKENPKILVDGLEECVLICQSTDAYQTFIRTQYETKVFQLKERGYSFHANDAMPEDDTHLNIKKYIVEPLMLYEEIKKLNEYYKHIECHYISVYVEKVLSLEGDELFSDLPTILDTIFLSLQRPVERSYTTKSVDTASTVLHFVYDFCMTRFQEMIDNIFNSTLPRSSSLSTSIKTVIMKDFNDKKKYTNLITPKNQSIVLNVMHTSISYFHKLHCYLMDRLPQFFLGDQLANLQPTVNLIGTLSTAMEKKLEDNVVTLLSLFNLIISKSIHSFMDTNYNIDQAQYKEYELNDPWVKSLISSLKEKMEPYSTHLKSEVFEELLYKILFNLAKQLETTVLRKTFSLLGGFRFDLDVQYVYKFFEQLSKTPIRSKFSKLKEIAQILSLEKETEILDYWGSTVDVHSEVYKEMDDDYTQPSNVWHITASEAKEYMNRRIDFKEGTIQSIDL